MNMDSTSYLSDRAIITCIQTVNKKTKGVDQWNRNKTITKQFQQVNSRVEGRQKQQSTETL